MTDSDKYSKYEVVVGLEVHAQLSTKSKMYCADSADFGAPPNTLVSPVSLGHPGTLPVLNEKAIEYAVKIGIATHCEIRYENQFARKNYFYADLPKGYQITQDKTPICTNGYLTFEVNGEKKKVGITRIHLEEDAGKSIHDIDPYYTLVDLNRAGTPLIEIVSQPDIRSGDEAMEYLYELQKLLRYLDISDANMEEGNMRCDANISVRLKGSTGFNPRSEVKNMNSARNVKRAIEYEFKRQVDLLEAGETLTQETRGYDAVKGITLSQRTKEHAHDYRYFPEPDLPPVYVTEGYVEWVRKKMPKLASQLKEEYMQVYGLPEYDARLLSEDKHTSAYFNQLLACTRNYKAASNWMLGPVKSYLNEHGISIQQCTIPPAAIAELIAMIDEGKTNFSVASASIFPEVARTGKSPMQVAQELNLLQSSDEGMIRQLAESVLAKYPEKVTEYRNGKKGLLGLFVGEVMKLSKGKADPKLTNRILTDMLQ
ncbi:MAG: Asp-tRNA(Asn)/Glu-tRNA(Gln) amidotransferase subunit GatB [Chitinophagales bacterium]|nr:Asp-tRNA(Asn)/Glu-tRNA(Gln) amidotransferase subunit GatB [Chitinophagales bacterium]MDW8419234.1 Asp-tRNA(Asn)/Glu-tRNA(Gln) amidotransferase subunit GatB [Chitinophagales bacterium]